MAQEFTVSLDKLNQLYLDTTRVLKARLQEIVGDRLNENHDENQFIETDILSQMTTDEVSSLRSRLDSTRLVSRQLRWPHISSALMHELDEGVSSYVMKAVNKLKIETVGLSEAMAKQLSKAMTKQEIHYIRKLIDRATKALKKHPQPELNQQHHVPRVDRDTDTSVLNGDMLIDIFDTHCLYQFSNFQFQTYSKYQFMTTIEMNKFLKQKKNHIANIFNESDANRTEFVLYPSWLIADDQFIIFNYFFCASYIVNELRVNPTRNQMKFSVYIIPKKIVSIYDENISFPATLPSNIAVFLEENGFNTFSRTAIDESVCDDPQTLYQVITHCLNRPHSAYLSQDILLIIDRRNAQNILYVVNASADDKKLVQLHQTHLLGMEFYILASNNANAVVKCYLRKGISERVRFYPEYLTFLVCRLFKRGNDMENFEYAQKVYSSSYRHGFGTDLNDPIFNKYHKLVLNASHISVNYNRNYVPSDLNEDIEEKHPHEHELDIGYEWSMQCNAQQVKAPFECPYIDFIMRELRKFSEINQQISQITGAKFNELLLSLALDHLTHIHSFCLDEPRRLAIKQFIQDSVGLCKREHRCAVLQGFSSRKRETQGRTVQLDNKDIQTNILMDTLSTLHCYLQHKTFDLYRGDVAGNSNKFGTIVQRSDKSLDDDSDEFDTMYTALLHLNGLEFNNILDFVTRVHVWCTENRFDFDALIYDVVDRERIKSNLFQFLSSFEQNTYFDCIYRAAFNINYEAKDQDNMNEVDHLKSFLINNDNISLNVFCQFNQWSSENEYDWVKIENDVKDKDKSIIFKQFDSDLWNEIRTFIQEEHLHRQNVKIDSIAAINFGVSVHEWLEYHETPEFNSFRDEIINGSASMIDEAMYETYTRQCLVLMVVYENKFGLLELMSIKLYTDTSDLCKLFRIAFWKKKSKKNKKMKKEFYWWALTLFKTVLYHSKPLDKLKPESTNPMTVYHGLSDVFTLSDNCPFYNGPISTTCDLLVAERFSGGIGLRWNICGSFSNPFRYFRGLPVYRISCFKEENEVLLCNSHLPISSTKNYERNEDTKIDLFLKQIQAYKQKEINASHFYSQIGFKFQKKWIETIKRHPLLYKPLDINKNEMVLHKLRTAFNVTALDAPYAILSTKFEQIKAFERFGHVFTLNIHAKLVDYFKECKYKLIFGNKETTTIQYNESIRLNGSNSKATILVSNETIFERQKEFELQQISITANKNEITQSFFHFDQKNKCIVLNDSDILSAKNDVIETLLNAKYQIKYCDVFNQNCEEQYGKEYKFKRLEQFVIPVNMDDYNQFSLMIAPFVNKTVTTNAEGKRLKYQSNLDDHGLFYALGTNSHKNKYSNPEKEGKLSIVVSKDLEKQKHCLVDRSRTNFVIQGQSKNDPPFFYINIGEYGLKPARYTLRSSDKDNGYLTNWLLLASNDGVEWVTLKEHVNDTTLKKEGPFDAAKWDINAKESNTS